MLPFFVLQALENKEGYVYKLIQNLKTSMEIEVTESTINPLLIRLMKTNYWYIHGLNKHRGFRGSVISLLMQGEIIWQK